jgi:hypothetical protein
MESVRMTDWITAVAGTAFVFLHMGLLVYAFRHEDKPFWRGYLDVATLRILWRRS